MVMRWTVPLWRDRQRTQSRPRVARAAEAARIAQAGVGFGLGSATAGVGVMLSAPVAMGPGVAGAGRSVAPELVFATTRAAQAAGRTMEDIWADALRAWLNGQEEAERAAASRPLRSAAFETRRQQVWSEIDETLSGLRAC